MATKTDLFLKYVEEMYLKGTFEKDEQVLITAAEHISWSFSKPCMNSVTPQANAAYAKMGKADKKTSDMAFDSIFGGGKSDEN